MGEKYRNEVLAHGGGKHPAELVEGTSLHFLPTEKAKMYKYEIFTDSSANV